jgi:hypothetical protein
MGRRKGSGSKAPKVKVAKFDLINPTDKPLHEPYQIMNEVRGEHHKDTLGARIALAWMIGNKADADGHVCLGKCVKASDLQRELVAWDYVTLLNKDVWESTQFDPAKKRALMDHELMHVCEAVDKNGDQKEDAKGRKMWRIRQHDVEEFSAVVRRHGTYKRDLEIFAENLMKSRQTPLFGERTAPASAAVN